MVRPVPTALCLAAALCLSLSLAAPAGSVEPNVVGFDVGETWNFEVSENVVEDGDYTMRKGVHFGVCRMDDSRIGAELSMSFLPQDVSQITSTMNLEREGGAYSTGWHGIGDEKDCLDAGVEYGAQEASAFLPIVVRRSVDRAFFESKGVQTCTIEVTPVAQLDWLEVEFEIRPTEEADINLMSSHGQFRDEDDSVRFPVDNPVRGLTYSFTVVLEVIPKSGQVSYVPNVWIGTDVRGEKSPTISGRSMIHETEYGDVVVEATDDMVFHPTEHRSVGIGMRGMSTAAELIMPREAGGVSFPGFDISEILSPSANLVATVGLVVLFMVSVLITKKLRLRGGATSVGDRVEDLEKEERKLRGMKKNVQREYFKGLITEQAFNKMTMEYEEKLMAIISKKDELRGKKPNK